jgi:glycolate oxidase
MLIAQSDATTDGELQRIAAACEAAGGRDIAVAENETESRLLLTARRLAYPALEKLGDVLVDDVAVPISKLAQMFARIERIAATSQAQVVTIAHAGDGNLHPLVVFDRRESADEARAVAVFEELMSEALALGGTITGEHGVARSSARTCRSSSARTRWRSSVASSWPSTRWGYSIRQGALTRLPRPG